MLQYGWDLCIILWTVRVCVVDIVKTKIGAFNCYSCWSCNAGRHTHTHTQIRDEREMANEYVGALKVALQCFSLITSF